MIFAFAAGIQPGPLQTYYITHALLYGWRKTLPSVLAPVFSDIPIIILVLFALQITSKLFLQILQCTGGIFLFLLAFGAWKNWRRLKKTDLLPIPSQGKTLLKAIGVNLLNPNPYLGWSLVMGPLFLMGWRENPVNGIVLLGGFYRYINSLFRRHCFSLRFGKKLRTARHQSCGRHFHSRFCFLRHISDLVRVGAVNQEQSR